MSPLVRQRVLKHGQRIHLISHVIPKPRGRPLARLDILPRYRGVIGVQHAGTQHFGDHHLMQFLQRLRQVEHPLAEGGAPQGNAEPPRDRLLSIERQVIAELAQPDESQQSGARQTTGHRQALLAQRIGGS